MADDSLSTYKNGFTNKLDGAGYLKTYYDETDQATYEINTQHIRDAIKCLKQNDVTGKKVLEIGCGPLIMNSLIMCNYFEEIYLSDFNVGMLEPLKQWVNNETSNFDNSYMVNYIADQHNVLPQDLEQQTRSRIKGVYSSDIHKHEILDDSNIMFDAIVTRFCVDSCSPDLISYNKAINNIMTILKPGGYFLQMGFFNDNQQDITKGFWNIGMDRFEDLRLSKECIFAAVENVEMTVLEWFERLHEDSNETTFENTSTFTLLARKQK